MTTPSPPPGTGGTTRRFPVLNQQHCRRDEELKLPRDVPWSFAETFRAQAEHNHRQTLERLAERGGLAPDEMWLAAHGKRLFRDGDIEFAKAVEWLWDALAGPLSPTEPAATPTEKGRP